MKKTKKEKVWVLQAQIISILRRLFVKSPMFSITKKHAQKEKKVFNKDGSVSKAHRVEYQCQICGQYYDDKKIIVEVVDKKGKTKTVKHNQIAVDHTDPFVPLEGLPRRANGLPDWNILIDRMFLWCDIWYPHDTYEKIKNKSRVLCWKCHDTVTQEQNVQRRLLKKQTKSNP